MLTLEQRIQITGTFLLFRQSNGKMGSLVLSPSGRAGVVRYVGVFRTTSEQLPTGCLAPLQLLRGEHNAYSSAVQIGPGNYVMRSAIGEEVRIVAIVRALQWP